MKRAALLVVLALGCGGATKPAPSVANQATTPPSPVVDDREAVEDTAVLVRRLAYEAFPQWAMAHPDQECPATVADLGETQDAWGTELRMLCGSTLPAGVKGVAVVSAGPDRMFETSDDVKSWETE